MDDRHTTSPELSHRLAEFERLADTLVEKLQMLERNQRRIQELGEQASVLITPAAIVAGDGTRGAF